MLLAPAAPKTRRIKAEKYFSQDFVQIDLKKLRNNVSRHLSERKKLEFIGMNEIEFPVNVKTH